MSDPFRSAAYPCPSCGAGLRPYLSRLVCDACGGMLIGVDDLRASITDLSGVDTEITVLSEEPLGRRCPRCERELTRARLELRSEVATRCHAIRCARDGLWFEQGWLVDVYTRLGRKLSAGAGPTYGWGPGALGVVGRGLLQPPRPRPRVVAPYRSAHAGRALPCPACRTSLTLDGERWACGGCRGVFVEVEALVELMSELRGEPWQPPPATGAPGDRACPVCAAALTVEGLDAIEVDRCAAHGIWFDADELAGALAGGVPRPRRGWLRRLLGGRAE